MKTIILSLIIVTHKVNHLDYWSLDGYHSIISFSVFLVCVWLPSIKTILIPENKQKVIGGGTVAVY